MLTILVGNVRPETSLDLDVSTVWSRYMPIQLVSAFSQYLDNFDESYNIVVRVYTDTIINWVGEQVAHSNIDFKNVEIITEFGTHQLDADGVIGDDWPYGIFNY